MRRIVIGAAAAMGLGACFSGSAPPEEVSIIGRLVEFQTEGLAVIPGASVFATTRDGTALAAGMTDANGLFVAGPLEKNVEVALVFEKEGFAPSVFSGETAGRDAFLFTGSVYQDRVPVAQAFVDEHSAAVLGTTSLMTLGTGGAGAIVRGRVTRLVDPERLGFVNVGGASVVIRDAAGNEYPVWYRDATGEVDPLATQTHAADARFAAFAVAATGANAALGLPTGQVTVSVTTPDGTFDETTVVLDGGITELDFFAVP